jgi:hypothetical protein
MTCRQPVAVKDVVRDIRFRLGNYGAPVRD